MTLPLLVFTAALAAAGPGAPHSRCKLQRADGARYEGACTALIEGENANLSLAAADAITSGAWKRGAKPKRAFAGRLSGGDDPPTPVELELYGRRGVLRTQYGWFAVSAAAPTAGSLAFEVDSAHEVAPTELDRDIVRRARELLATSAAWNRADNRQCPPSATTLSIYCAMERATIEVTGAFHHRRPALQVVRTIVDERTAGRPYDHRLMDYNNDATTTLADVHSLFDEALARMARTAR